MTIHNHDFRRCETCKEIKESEHGINPDILTKPTPMHENCPECGRIDDLARDHYWRDINK